MQQMRRRYELDWLRVMIILGAMVFHAVYELELYYPAALLPLSTIRDADAGGRDFIHPMGIARAPSHRRSKRLVVVNPSKRATILRGTRLPLACPIYCMRSHRHPDHPVSCRTHRLG